MLRRFRFPRLSLAVLAVWSLGLAVTVAEEKPNSDKPCCQKDADPHAWRSLFDGKTLGDWKSTDFGGQGEVTVEDGAIVMEMGNDMTGITFQGKPARSNYEIEFEARRLDGVDFFATTTFPVGKEHCSFVVGGWGGTVVGLSNVDYYDASDNMTTRFRDFKDEQWYKVRIRVSDHRITTWIDDEQIVDQPREGHEFGIRFEVDPCRPLGISTWRTTGAVKNLRVRTLKPEEVAADKGDE
jgi:hypothetical protein